MLKENRHRYDHHQGSFQDTLDDKHKIRLSSAGLIYKYVPEEISLTMRHFGREILQKLTGTEGETLEVIFKKTYSVS
jgi:uncharacterized UPF0160 family protein